MVVSITQILTRWNVLKGNQQHPGSDADSPASSVDDGGGGKEDAIELKTGVDIKHSLKELTARL